MRIAGDGFQQCRGTRESGLFGTVRQRTAREFAQFGGISGVTQPLVGCGQRLEIEGTSWFDACSSAFPTTVSTVFSAVSTAVVSCELISSVMRSTLRYVLLNIPFVIVGFQYRTGRLDVPVCRGVTVALNVSIIRDLNFCDCSCGTIIDSTMRSVYCASACSPSTDASRF